MITAGFPTTIAFAGTSLVTTAPAPTNAFSPILRPGNIVAFAPIIAPFSTIVFGNAAGYCFERGFLSFVKATHGPIKTLSYNVMPSHT